MKIIYLNLFSLILIVKSFDWNAFVGLNKTKIEASQKNILNLNGINQFYQTLIILNLRQNRISTINELKSMINLEKLDLSQNKIIDISSLSNLIKLTDLDLSKNSIKKIDSLYSIN